MKMAELCPSLRDKGIKIIYVIHDERLPWSDELDLQRFAEKLRKEGFIPLLAKDCRPHGSEIVSSAIGGSDFTMVFAGNEKMMQKAKSLGVPFVEISDFNRLIQK